MVSSLVEGDYTLYRWRRQRAAGVLRAIFLPQLTGGFPELGQRHARAEGSNYSMTIGS
jgi:hypothetical protein